MPHSKGPAVLPAAFADFLVEDHRDHVIHRRTVLHRRARPAERGVASDERVIKPRESPSGVLRGWLVNTNPAPGETSPVRHDLLERRVALEEDGSALVTDPLNSPAHHLRSPVQNQVDQPPAG